MIIVNKKHKLKCVELLREKSIYAIMAQVILIKANLTRN